MARPDRSSHVKGAAAFSLIAISLLLMIGSVIALRFAAGLLQSASDEIEAEFAFRSAEKKLHTSIAVDRLSLSPTLQLTSTTGVSKRFARRAILVSTRGLPNLPHSNWSRLVSIPDGCIRWDRETKPPRAPTVLTSNFSCREFPAQFKSESTTPGNLKLELPLSLSSADKGDTRIAAVGEVSLRELAISSVTSASIEILAGGDLSIDRLVLSTTDHATLLLYSATGKIMIGKIDGPAFWCEGEPPPHAFRLRFEARDVVELNGKSLPRGCLTPRDPQVWPALQILGGIS